MKKALSAALFLLLLAFLICGCNKKSPNSLPSGSDTAEKATEGTYWHPETEELPYETWPYDTPPGVRPVTKTADPVTEAEITVTTASDEPGPYTCPEYTPERLELRFFQFLQWGGGKVCHIHDEAYHEVGVLRNYFYDLGGYDKAREVNEWCKNLPINVNNGCEGVCHCPGFNIVNVVKTYGISRADFEYYVNTFYPAGRLASAEAIDVIYNGTDAEIESFFALKENGGTNTEFAERIYADEATKSWLARVAGGVQLIVSPKAEDFYEKALTICPLRENEKDIGEDGRYMRRSKADYYTIAEIVKYSGISKDSLKEEYAKRVKAPEDTWEYDFDLLYDNLDYYAELLGTQGYDYPWQVDALIRK